MSRLNLKLLRDLGAARWQLLAISLLASLGVALFHGSLVGWFNQKASYDLSYERLRFADLWVGMDSAPRGIVRQLARLPHVVAVEGRLVANLLVEQSRGRRPRVTGRLISLPAGREPAVNRVRVIEGSGLTHRTRRELLLEASFARRQGYRPGELLWVVINGERLSFRIAGIATSPEYIYAVQSKQFLVPSPDTFGVMFVAQPVLEAALGRPGEINEVAFRTDPGRAREVGALAARRLQAYGPQAPLTQAEQPSNQLLQSDLEGNRAFLLVMPTLFLVSAALAVSLVLARWVHAQRGQVGFLRASGYSSRAVLGHYLGMGMVVGVAGGLLGAGLGHLLGQFISEMYGRFLQMPYRVQEVHPQVGLWGLGMSLGACGLGALGPAFKAASIPPAEAMRGVAPGRPSLLARARLPLWLALPIRNLMRRPGRSLTTAADVAFAVVLVVIAGTFRDSMDESMRIYLQEIQKYDIVAGFEAPRSQAVLEHLRHWPGVLRVEGSLEIPVRVRHGTREKETVAIGVLPGARLRLLPGPDGKHIVPPPGGVLFSDELATRLDVEAGDYLRLEYIFSRRDRKIELDLHAGAPVRQPIGLPVYLRLEDLQRWFGTRLGMPPDAISGALLQVDPRYATGLRDRLRRMEGVAMVQTKAELEQQIAELTAFSKTFIGIMFLFATLMAFAGTYTATDSVLWERTRELATLRTLGFGMDRLTVLVSIENLAMALGGAIGGLAPARWVADVMIRASSTEGFTIRSVLLPETYWLAIGGAVVVTLGAQIPGLRRIARLDLAEATRMQEE